MSGAVAIAVGKRACELMDQGNPEIDVIKNVSASNPGFTMDGAAKFTMIAASAYSPQHLGGTDCAGTATSAVIGDLARVSMAGATSCVGRAGSRAKRGGRRGYRGLAWVSGGGRVRATDCGGCPGL